MRSGLNRFAFLSLILLLPAALSGRQSAGDASPHSEVQLVSEVGWIRAAEPFTVALRITLDPAWHTYWINAGDSGLPLHVQWQLPEGFDAGPLQWPVPERIPVPPLMSFGYENELIVLVEITPPAEIEGSETVRLRGTVDWLVCADVCIPASGEVELEIPVRRNAARPTERSTQFFEHARAKLPKPELPGDVRAWTDDIGYVVEFTNPRGATLRAPYLFVDSTGIVEHSPPQEVVRSGARIQLRVARSEFADGDAARIGGVLVSDAAASPSDAWWISAEVAATPPDDVVEAATAF
jgi:DsbC/DsbD-like thiol-disulfide interchange protein